ncbi:MAG: GntP family permease [Spirochaetaceae bacterium]|jgi:GntP family gluconate:H+ symporter|nr:GntP family permease [Spirochaetaceae bacterium]
MEVSGTQLILALVIGLFVLILLCLKTKVHAFLALIIASIVIGLIGGLPLVVDTNNKVSIVNSITGGFGGTLGSIGIIIGFGVMMGEIFQLSGASNRMAFTFLKLFGKGREEFALALTGYIVSIPIFCDSAFVVLCPIAKSLSRTTRKSIVALGASLAAGLVVTHTMVPPTPGPLAVVGNLASAGATIDLGRYIILSLIFSIPITIVAVFYARHVGRKIYQVPAADGENWERPENKGPDYTTALSMDTKDMPGTFVSFFPLLAPILLILCNTVLSALKLTEASFLTLLLYFIGQPIVAVGIGLLLAIYTLGFKYAKGDLLLKMENGMKSAGIILLVTGGGGALGRVLSNSGIGSYIAGGLAQTGLPVFILPLVIATLVRFAQGSGTVALTTASAITAPIVVAANGNPYLAALAACVGGLFCAYFNDSYFWVVNRLIGISETKEQLRIWTLTTGVCWLTGVVFLFIFGIFLR